MNAPLPSFSELLLRAEGGKRAVPALDDGSSALFMIADQIAATPDDEAGSNIHTWAGAVRFVARTLASEGNEIEKWLCYREKETSTAC